MVGVGVGRACLGVDLVASGVVVVAEVEGMSGGGVWEVEGGEVWVNGGVGVDVTVFSPFNKSTKQKTKKYQ